MKKSPKQVLKEYWGYEEFRGSQEQIIHAILEKNNVLALLPTGGGKSICYQIPTMMNDGICIVVSPLIALIQDQVENLKAKGIKAVALTGGIPFEEVNNLLDNCLYGNYKFLYLSPERLRQELVQNRIQQMQVNLIAIDEAHCISQWGHDFRPAYLECSKLKTLFPEVPVIALTATATKPVVKDIKENLNFGSPIVVKDSFLRNNISLKILWEEDKRYRLKFLCESITKSAIVYVRTRRLAQEIAYFLNSNGHSSTFFHGGISKNEKEQRLKLWLDNKVQIMVATNAFGMGIDKPDVQLVAHYQIPDCLENYFQEAGRAGRDGNHAEAILLTNKNDIEKARNQFLSVLPDTAFIKLIYNKLNNYLQIAYGEGTDLTFPLHFNAFCDTYRLSPLLTYNAFRILDQNSVISLSESFDKRTTVQFVTSKERLFAYLEKNASIAPILQTILRTYGGLFDFETKVNTYLIAKKAKVAEAKILEVLEKLQADEIISYSAQTSDLQITFLVPREDDRTINVFAKKVAERQQMKVTRFKQMIAYLTNSSQCRNKFLLSYFGESLLKDCGICDVCRNTSSEQPNLEIVSKEVIQLLHKRAHSSRELQASLGYQESIILKAVQQLLEDGKIRINTINQYELKII